MSKNPTYEEAADRSDLLALSATLRARAKKARAKKVPSKIVGSGRLVGQTGAEMIAWERLRQISEERWSYRHDDKHRGKQLAKAASSYLITHCAPDEDACGDLSESRPAWDWPWAMKWWKPSKDPVRNLVKAGALIAAEIDRLTRAAKKTRLPNDAGEPRENAAQHLK